MQGVIWDGARVRVVNGLQLRSLRSHEVRVRVVAAGLCHSDLACTTGSLPVPTPVVMGHEAAGVVDAVGPEVHSLAIGDHVVLTTLGQCGRCRVCETGHPTWCSQTLGRNEQPFTLDGRPVYSFANTSAFAELAIVRENQAVRIPAEVPLDVACIIGCAVLTGAGAVWNTAGVRAGHKVAVIGLGGVGLSAVQAAIVAGAARVIAADVVPAKAALATRCGATDYVAVTVADATEQIRQLAPDGVDVSIVCVWKTEMISVGLEILAAGGKCVVVASPPPGERLSLDVNTLIYVDRSLVGCRYGSTRPLHDVPYVIDLYTQGRFALDAMISGNGRLADIESQLAALASGVDGRLVMSVP